MQFNIKKFFKNIQNNNENNLINENNIYDYDIKEDKEKYVTNKKPPQWNVISKYSIGPNNYYIYRGEDGLVHLLVNEPKMSNKDELIEVISGIRKATSNIMQYEIEKLKSGYGAIYPLIIDPHVEEISYSGYTTYVSIIHKLIPARWIIADLNILKDEADSIAIELARKAGKTVSIASPYAEGITSEGNRISVSFMSEISHFGSSFILRKYPEKPLTMVDLIASKVLSPSLAAYLWLLAESQGFIIISGSMGSGKTTFLQALASLLPPYSKIITIEDTPELKLLSPNWDSFITRPKLPGEEIVEVSLEDLLKFALRRRADYVIVGEVRGREAKLLAQAATSGYGAMTTIHADSSEGVILRLRFEPIKLPALFMKAITAIAHIRTLPSLGGKSIRKIFEVSEIDNDNIIEIYKIGNSQDLLEKIIARSSKLEAACERLGFHYSEVLDELKSRVEFLENSTGKTPEEFYVSLSKFYVDKYGDII
ncbi:MAG: type II secretion system protein E [Caldisphaera sp.]|nr:MAG: type II secretion system protein E [Caldisphaera sp.]